MKSVERKTVIYKQWYLNELMQAKKWMLTQTCILFAPKLCRYDICNGKKKHKHLVDHLVVATVGLVNRNGISFINTSC